jgi:hypothetical protein
MNKKNKVKVKTTIRTDKKFSVSMATIALVAILAVGSTSTIVMAQSDNGEGQRGTDWNGICNQIQSILVESCSQLVNTDGSLTADGQRAHDCIQNGILLGSGALVLVGGNAGTLPLIIGGLKALSSQTGCDNIANWDSLNPDQLNLLTQIFHK